MKEKVKKIIADATAKLNEGVDSDDQKAVIESIRFLDGVCQAYLSYLSLLNYEFPEDTDQH